MAKAFARRNILDMHFISVTSRKSKLLLTRQLNRVFFNFFLLPAALFRRCHSGSSSSISAYPQCPPLSQPCACPPSWYAWTFTVVFLFSSCLADPYSSYFVQYVSIYCMSKPSQPCFPNFVSKTLNLSCPSEILIALIY